MSKPQIKKSWLEEQFAQGKNVETVLAEVNSTLPEGEKLSIAKFSEGCKGMGINLRKKPKPLAVQFVDDSEPADAAPETTQAEAVIGS